MRFELHGAPSVVLDIATISQMLQLNEGKVIAFASQRALFTAPCCVSTLFHRIRGGALRKKRLVCSQSCRKIDLCTFTILYHAPSLACGTYCLDFSQRMPCRRGMWCLNRAPLPVRTSEFVTCVATTASSLRVDAQIEEQKHRECVRALPERCQTSTCAKFPKLLEPFPCHACRRNGTVIVIGAGISGVATALQLQKHGFEVL